MQSKGLFTSWMVGFAVLISVSGCGNSDASATSSVQPAASSLAANTTSKVDGFKEFKFGMSAAQITKLAACSESYNELIADVKRYVANGDESIADYKAHPDQEYLKDNSWVSMLGENRTLISKLKSHDETLSIDWFTKGILFDRNFRYGICTVEMFGEVHSPTLGFENGKLISVRVTVDIFNNEKFQALHKTLAEKYGSIYVPTAEQIGSFNNKTLGTVSATYAANQVRLSAEDTQYGRLINIYYFAPDKAEEVGKESTVGQVKTGDL